MECFDVRIHVFRPTHSKNKREKSATQLTWAAPQALYGAYKPMGCKAHARSTLLELSLDVLEVLKQFDCQL